MASGIAASLDTGVAVDLAPEPASHQQLPPLRAVRLALIGTAPAAHHPSAWWARFLQLARTPADRRIATVAASVPANLAIAAVKLVFGVAAGAPTPLLIAAVLVNLSVAVSKLVAMPLLVAPHRAPQSRARVLSIIGLLTTITSMGIVLASLPAVLGAGALEAVGLHWSLGLALLCTVETACAIGGLATAHRNGDSVLAAVRLASLANALGLLVVMQGALIALDPIDGAMQYIGLSGAAFGAAGTACGVVVSAMAVRHRRPARSRIDRG